MFCERLGLLRKATTGSLEMMATPARSNIRTVFERVYHEGREQASFQPEALPVCLRRSLK